MVEFYTNLWHKKLGKLESLRQAQLTMLHKYDPKVGRLRSPDFGTTVPLPKSAPLPEAGQKPLASPYYWGAFVLSGDWR